MRPLRLGVFAVAAGVSVAACAPGAATRPSPVRAVREPSPERLRAVVDGVVPRMTVLQAMAGRPAAVPLDDVRVVFREGSRHPGPPPLFVIDGFPVERGVRVLDVDPALIIGIEILKGPAAVERFGLDAFHGVVLIRTRHE
jgi:TonB-dependent Receptor Plug Domain